MRNINNVVPAEAKAAMARAFADDDVGASFCFVARFEHDLASFEALAADARFVEAAKAGNPFAQRQLQILASTPEGAARLKAAIAGSPIATTAIQQGAPQ
jgi:hypothetical protein